MSQDITPRDIQRWYPKRWSEIAGNAEVKSAWNRLIRGGVRNLLLTGPSRTCKTRIISLGVRSLLCTQRTEDLNPCGSCSTCNFIGEARSGCTGIFQSCCGTEYSYYPIDCENATREELQGLDDHVDLNDPRTIVYLDEVAALNRRGLETLLLKPIDESRATWIASAITVRKRLKQGRTKVTEGLTIPMQGRFGDKVGTSLPSPPELSDWIKARCSEWGIRIGDPEVSIPLMVERTGQRVGYVLHLLAYAKGNGGFGPDDVQRFNFGPPD